MDLGLTLFPIVAAPFVGSFLATVALRLPHGAPIAIGRSACPSCHRTLSATSLVPVLSWVAQGARCRHCNGRISSYYPIVELVALAVAAWASAAMPDIRLVVVTCLLGWMLLTLSAIDLREHLLPDRLTIPLALAGLGATAVVDPDAVAGHVLAALAGLAGAWLLARAYAALRGRTGLGMGDVKLIAAAGAWVGPDGLASVILIAASAGLVFALGYGLARRRLAGDLRVPFGPFLAAGIWLTWLYGPVVLAGMAP